MSGTQPTGLVWHLRCPWDIWPGYNINDINVVLHFSPYEETGVWALNMSLEHFEEITSTVASSTEAMWLLDHLQGLS